MLRRYVEGSDRDVQRTPVLFTGGDGRSASALVDVVA